MTNDQIILLVMTLVVSSLVMLWLYILININDSIINEAMRFNNE